MAIDIATHLRNQVNKVSETMARLEELQLVTSEVSFQESISATWQLRQHFMDILEEQWDELWPLLSKEVIPLIADIKGVKLD